MSSSGVGAIRVGIRDVEFAESKLLCGNAEIIKLRSAMMHEKSRSVESMVVGY